MVVGLQQRSSSVFGPILSSGSPHPIRAEPATLSLPRPLTSPEDEAENESGTTVESGLNSRCQRAGTLGHVDAPASPY